jgi:hypothetical protein
MGWPTFAKKPPGGDVRPSVRKTTDSCMARAVRVRRRGRQEGDRSQSDRSVARRSAAAIRAIKARFPHRFSLNVRSSAYCFRGTRCGAGRIWPSHRPCRRRKLKGLKWLPGGSRPLPGIDCANQTFRRSEPLLGTVVPKMRLLPTIAISPLEQMGILRSHGSAAFWAPDAAGELSLQSIRTDRFTASLSRSGCTTWRRLSSNGNPNFGLLFLTSLEPIIRVDLPKDI